MKKINIIELLIIIGLGLTPLLWFHGNQVILGHDAGLTLSPISHFFDRLYAWTERFGFGSDQTYAISGFFIHGLEALTASLGFNLQNIQKIVFIFWFLLPGLTMYYFSTSLSKKLNLKYFALPASIFYMFNHFLLQGWFVAERTKFSVYAALPLVMVFLFDWEEKRRSTFKTALLLSLTLFFLNGEASLPLFGGLILSFIVFIIFYFVRGFSWKKLKKLSKLVSITTLISAFLNAYSILPYGHYVLQAYSNQISQAGGLGGVLGWIDYVSGNSSLSNLFRLQGIPEWYLNNLHPYSSPFLNNPLLIAISFLIAISAFLPLYLIKESDKRKKIIFFSFLALLAMIFMAGSHRPFGAIYVFLINFFPGFIAFRNPLYKFAPALWFSYAILIGFTINYFLQKMELRRKLLVYSLYFALSFGIILYSFPFLTGSFFDYMVGLRSMRVDVPQYVLDFRKWVESSDRIGTKVLALPPPNSENKFDAYTWGYWSLSPLTSLLTNAVVINESNFMSASEIRLVETLYKMMKMNEPGWQNFASLLGIKSFLLRKDFVWNLKGSPTYNPLEYEEALKSSDLKLVKKFGEWEVYDFKDESISNIELFSNVNYLVGDVTDIGKVSSLPDFNAKEPIYVSATVSDDSEEILKMKDKLYLVPACVSCNLQHKFINIDLFRPLITRESIFYPLVVIKTRLEEKKLISRPEKVNYYLYKSLRNTLALDMFVSQKKDSELLKDELSDYGKSLESLDKPLNDYLSSVETIDNNFLLELNDVLRIEKTIIIRNSSDLSDKETLDLLNEKYRFLENLKEKVDSVIWRTTDEINKRFLVVSNSDLEFDFLYRTNFSGTLSAMVNFTLDDKNYEVDPKSLSSGWFSLGKLSLSKGIHKLKVEQPKENLYPGSSSIQLNSSSDFSCFSSNTITGNKNDIYKISFQHKRLAGGKKFFAKILSGNINPNPLDTTGDILNSTSVWDSYAIAHLLGEVESFYLTICNPPSPDKEEFTSSIELKDINIRKVAVPDVVFYHSSSAGEPVNSKFDKVSQTEYSVSLGSDNRKKAIMLGESYNNNWVLEDYKDSIKFTANGYANGWIIKGDKKDIRIKYKLQDFVNLGFAISGVSFILSALYLLTMFRKK